MNSKKDIVKMLLKDKTIDNKDEEELIDVLFNDRSIIDVDGEMKNSETWKDRLADKITLVAGSWSFIIIFVLVLISWIVFNWYLDKSNKAFDPYPFILLNLFLSCVASLQAPIIMMSQNRFSKKEMIRSKNDYKTDLKSQLILEQLHEEIKLLKLNQVKIIELLNEKN